MKKQLLFSNLQLLRPTMTGAEPSRTTWRPAKILSSMPEGAPTRTNTAAVFDDSVIGWCPITAFASGVQRSPVWAQTCG